MVDIIIEFLEDLVSLLIPDFKLAKATEHKILLPQNLQQLIGTVLAYNLNKLMDPFRIIIDIVDPSQIL